MVEYVYNEEVENGLAKLKKAHDQLVDLIHEKSRSQELDWRDRKIALLNDRDLNIIKKKIVDIQATAIPIRIIVS